MKPNQINIDGVLYDLTPAGNPVFDAGKINDQLERIMAHPSAAAEPKGKEWEINCIELGGRYYWLQKDGGYLSTLYATHIELDSLLSNPNHIIHSVRRLSDNEVFAVGDWFSNNTANIYSEHKIERFEVEEGQIIVYYELGNGGFYESLKGLKKIAPARTPLFTTTDGEEISESQSLVLVFAVTPKWEIMECSAEFANPNTYKEKAGQEPLFKVFFHKQSAVDYIADNKPLYSLNDLLAALPDEASKEGIAAILRAKKSSL